MNIILIISDTFRYDNLFSRAGDAPHTPHVDEMVRRSVSLSKMYASGFPTTNHRRNVLSGRRWPRVPRESDKGEPGNRLPELLKEGGGYVTQFLADTPHLVKHGFHSYFDAAYTMRGQEGDTFFLRMNHAIEHSMPPEKTRNTRHFQDATLVDLHKWTNRYWRGEEDRFAARMGNLAVEWLEENYRYHPFFLWLDFFDPHEPWDPPEYRVRRHDPVYTGVPMIHPNYGRATDLSTEELHNLKAHYLAEVEMVDRHIGRVLQKIEDLGLWSNSIVVFTTDHGTSLGEHNRTGKGNRNRYDDRYWPPYPEIAHIPFLISSPDLPAGESVDTLVDPTDILPTLLDLVDVRIESVEPFHGISFAPQLRGDSHETNREHVVTGALEFLTKTDGTEPPVLYTTDRAYVPLGAEGKRELYDLLCDPFAAKNLAENDLKTAEELHTDLKNWLLETGVPEEALARLRSP